MGSIFSQCTQPKPQNVVVPTNRPSNNIEHETVKEGKKEKDSSLQANKNILPESKGQNHQRLIRSSLQKHRQETVGLVRTNALTTCDNNEGLPNVINTCFLNSVIQFLFSANKFRLLIISLQKQSRQSKEVKLLSHLQSIFVSLRQKSSRSTKSVAMNEIADYLQEIYPAYTGRSQQDAFTFLMYFISSCQGVTYQLSDLFRVQYSLHCGCKPSYLRISDYHIEKQNSVCGHCKRQVLLKYHFCPDYLIVFAKNALNNQQNIELETHTGERVGYQFLSGITYTGSGESGHYVSLRKNEDEDKNSYKWLVINDQFVNRITVLKHEFRSFNIVLYEKKEARKMSRMKQISQKKMLEENEHGLGKPRVIKPQNQLEENVIYEAKINVLIKVIRLEEDIKIVDKRNIFFVIERKQKKKNKLFFKKERIDYSIRILNHSNFYEISHKETIKIGHDYSIGKIVAEIEKIFLKKYQDEFDKFDRGGDEDFYDIIEVMKKNCFKISDSDSLKPRLIIQNEDTLPSNGIYRKL